MLCGQAKAAAKIGTITIEPINASAVVGVSPASFQVTITKDGPGTMHVTLSFNSTAGVDVAFSPTEIDYGPFDVSKTTILTLTPAVGAPRGAFSFTVTASDQTGHSASASETLYIKTPTTVNGWVGAPPAEFPADTYVPANYPTTFKALLETANGVPIADKTVEFKFDVGGPLEMSLGTATTGSDGVAVLPDATIPAGLPVGSTYLVGFFFSDSSDPIYSTSSSTALLTVIEAPTVLVTSNRTGIRGQTINLQAVLWAGWNKLSAKSVAFFVDDVQVGTATTDVSGLASLPYTVPSDFPAGSHAIRVEFDGSLDPDFNSCTKSATLSVDWLSTVVVTSNRTGVLGKAVTLYGTLWSGSTRISNKELTFSIDGSAIGSAVTDGTGTASFTYTLPSDMGAGAHSVSVDFKASSDLVYTASSKSATITVEKQTTVVVSSDRTGTRGYGITLYGTLWSGSTRIAGKSLAFLIDGVSIGSALTDATGVASLNYMLPLDMSVGTHTVTIGYNGDSDPIYSSSSKVVSITVR